MLAIVVAATISSQAPAQVTNAPLYLSINGGGNVSPLTNGESLVVGQTYNMVATPDPGFVFSSWNPVNVFTFTDVVLDAYGNPLPPVVSTVASPVANFTYEASLDFVMQSDVLIESTASVTINKGTGWQANFEPISLNLQLGGSNLILSWPTNFVGFSLQATTNIGPVAIWTTNLPTPVVINGQFTVTNPISGTQQFFRLSQ